MNEKNRNGREEQKWMRRTEMDEKNKIGIVELIDRTLNKGVILNADLIITVADVPLLAANLRLALASVETMLKYGVMGDWLMASSLKKENKLIGNIKNIKSAIPVKEENKLIGEIKLE